KRRRLEPARNHAGGSAMPPPQLLEAALGNPDPIARRVEVDEKAQDAIAVRRSVRACVDVHQLVRGMRRKPAPLLLPRPDTARPRLPTAGELRDRGNEKLAHPQSMLAQKAPRPGGHAGR